MSWTKPKTGALADAKKRGGRYIVICDDPEQYETAECGAKDIVAGWCEMMYGVGVRIKDVDAAEYDAFVKWADDPDNWRGGEDGNSILTWEVGGESSGTITFYHKSKRRR